MALTDKEIQALKPGAKKYKVFDGDGLHLIVLPNGSRYWIQKYYFERRPEEITFGTYPRVSLKQARELRDEARRKLASGVSPRGDKQQEKVAAVNSFEGIAQEWLAMMSAPKHSVKAKRSPSSDTTPESKPARAALDPATTKKHRWILATYLNPAIGQKPMSEITAMQLLPVLKQIEAAGKNETAHRVRALASRIFCYAHATGRAPQGDVTWSLRDALAPTIVTHHASITDPDRVGKLLLAIDTYTGSPETRCALKLAPLVMLRPFELRFGEWQEVDFKKAEWRIPPERMKMSSPHIVPLSKQAVTILCDLHEVTGNERYLFPVLGVKEGVMSENTVNQALRTLGYDGHVMTGHGFRSMASTLLNEQQLWHPDAIERQLAHSPRDKIRASYNYAEHLPERRRMMQAWADYLDELRNTARGEKSKSKSHRTDKRGDETTSDARR